MTIRLDAFQDYTDRNVQAYREVGAATFDDGSSFANYMPGSVGGKRMRATLIPHARPGGGSRAYDPHKPPHKRIHVDPHLEGQSVVVDLAQITPDLAQEAMDLGQQFADQHADRVAGIESLRLRSSAAFHLIGAKQRAEAAEPPRDEPPAPPPQALQTPQRTDPARRAIKAASFDVPRDRPTLVDTSDPARTGGGLLGRYQQPRPQQSAAPAPVSEVGPPTRKVTFGVPGFGLHEACYHDVIVRDQQFILVYDERYRGGSKYLPNQIEGSFAARIDGDTVDYQLTWPDLSFTDPGTGRTYFTLLIEGKESNQDG